MWIPIDDEDVAELKSYLESAPTNTLRKYARRIDAKEDAVAKRYIAAAKKQYETVNLEFDPDAAVSYGENGAYVMAWRWVYADEAGFRLCLGCGEPEYRVDMKEDDLCVVCVGD